jgi:hypothetical protein
MENIPYHKIVEDTIRSKENHNELIEYITLGRWKLEDETDVKFEAGRATSPLATKEVFTKIDNLSFLKGYDIKLDKIILPKYKSDLAKASMN